MSFVVGLRDLYFDVGNQEADSVLVVSRFSGVFLLIMYIQLLIFQVREVSPLVDTIALDNRLQQRCRVYAVQYALLSFLLSW